MKTLKKYNYCGLCDFATDEDCLTVVEVTITEPMSTREIDYVFEICKDCEKHRDNDFVNQDHDDLRQAQSLYLRKWR